MVSLSKIQLIVRCKMIVHCGSSFDLDQGLPTAGATHSAQLEQCSPMPVRFNAFEIVRCPLDAMARAHASQLEICDCLERIADGLPSDVDRDLCGTVIESLRIDLPIHHRDEEEGLFPLLEERAEPQDNITDVLARLALEHATDESFADELLDSLEALSRGEIPANPDMLGYMLRGFFESYRRHIYWENAIVLPLAQLRLGQSDLVTLSERMAKHRAETLGQAYSH
jgi:hemerythrin-like domain-containing protein